MSGQLLNRRTFLACSSAAGVGIGLSPLVTLAQEPDPETTAADVMTKDCETSISKGLDYLSSRQRANGSFGGDFGAGGYGRNVAVCGLAGLAFMSQGSTPGRGNHGREVTRCVDYILANTQENGFIVADGSASHGPMYGHGFATLFLAEVYGMSMNRDVRTKLVKAVDIIVRNQNDEGGWRYQPRQDDADISVTVCQIMALRAASNAGVHVPKETIDKCVGYVKRCQNPDGGFMYTLEGGESEFARSAAGVVALYSAGIYEGEEIEKGLGYLMERIPKTRRRSRETHYYYGHYYAVQAMWHTGGQRWQKWYPKVRDALIERQNKADGKWTDAISSEYGTAMSCIVLQMPNNYLPILQR